MNKKIHKNHVSRPAPHARQPAKATLLDLPEKFPIKAFGLDDEQFTDAVRTIIRYHVAPEDILSWKNNSSRQGNYLAITVTIMARTQLQLDSIYVDLSASEFVKLAL